MRRPSRSLLVPVLGALIGACSGDASPQGGSAGTSTAPSSDASAEATGSSAGSGGSAGASGSTGGSAGEGGSPDAGGSTEASAASGGSGVDSGSAPDDGAEASAATDGVDASSTRRDAAAEAGAAVKTLEELQRAYVELRFGMFIHFGILTYTGSWAQPNLDISQFNPTKLDPSQWADAAISAKMKYGVLTTRHHDGFALWDSKAGTFDVGSIPWKGGQGDVVKAYVDAFRAKGLLPGFYYSVFDATEGVVAGTITPEHLAYLKTQITELLTNYGPIHILVFDGWSWKMGHHNVAYEEIHDLVKSLQPNCLVTDHSHLPLPWDGDITNFEEPAGDFSPPDNTYAATQGNKIVSGNDWFWAPSSATQNPMDTSTIVDTHLKVLEPRWTNFLLNCPPNREGLLSPNIVSRLAEVGAAWSPNAARPPLPAQGPQNEHPYSPVSATATSGNASLAIDGLNDTHVYTVWQTTGALPQSITLDLGKVRPSVGLLGYVPKFLVGSGGATDGAITAYTIQVSSDGAMFTDAATGTWAANAKMKVATFPPVAARYVRLLARAGNGGSAAATEITVGARP